MKLSVVIPCYNEEDNIRELVQAFVDAGFEAAVSGGFELVLVDNGSRDGTAHEIALQAAQHTFVKQAAVAVNEGYGYGITQGLAVAAGDFVGWMHADLQTLPEEFLAFLKAYDAGECSADRTKAVFARGLRRNRPWLDSIITFGMGCYESVLFGTKMFDINAQPTVMNREIYESWSNPPKDFSL
ncbi:MAG: glycosyltransferase family 2 protein, partial [Ruthenibacterium sp.]